MPRFFGGKSLNLLDLPLWQARAPSCLAGTIHTETLKLVVPDLC